MSRAGSRPATIADAAQRPHMSRGTASRVLNRYPHVRSQVRVAVQRTMHELRYGPDDVTGSLPSREAQTLGLVAADSRTHSTPRRDPS